MKVWLIAAMTADGKIAQSGDQSSLDWTSPEDTRFFIEKTKQAGVVIMGRKTFETIGKPLNGRRLIVMTSQDGMIFDGKGVEYTTLQPKELLDKLASEGVETVVIGGGASVYSRFIADGLVTDLFLTIEPIMFGLGIPLASGFGRLDLHLEEVRKLNDQAVLLHYSI